MEGPTPQYLGSLIHAANHGHSWRLAYCSISIRRGSTSSDCCFSHYKRVLYSLILALVSECDIKRVLHLCLNPVYMMVAICFLLIVVGTFHLINPCLLFKGLAIPGRVPWSFWYAPWAGYAGKDGRIKKCLLLALPLWIGNGFIAFPPFAGFLDSKDNLTLMTSTILISLVEVCLFCVAAGAFVTKPYFFRSLFMTFHGANLVRRTIV